MNRIVFLVFLLFFFFFQSTSIYGGDAGDLVTAAFTGSTAHPPGYPLYSFLGYLTSHLPWNTVAWRVGLLSSIPMAGTVTLIGMLIYRLTRSRVASLLASATLAFTYVFWLYGIVPEVFALNAFLTSLILYTAYLYTRHPSRTYIYAIALLMGLGLAHHHIIVFALPAIAVLLWKQKKILLSMPIGHKALAVGIFLAGLLPYAWAYYAGVQVAPVVWDDPVNTSNMFRLISRADYGSFQSGISFGQDIRSRLLQLPAIFDLYIQDFTYIGFVLFLAGVGWLHRKSRSLSLAFLTGFVVTGPLYFFYASYLFTSAFHIATAERFLTPSYLFIGLYIGLGMYATLTYTKRLHRTVYIITTAVLVFFPLMLFTINYPKLSILKYDATAEKFGRDILNTVESNSILLLQGDHPVFNTQYMYWTQGMRHDVRLIHLTKLLNRTGIKQIQKYSPDVYIHHSEDGLENILRFLEGNYDTHPLYASQPFELIPIGYRWVPYGLLYRLYKGNDIPSYESVAARNKIVWETYQHPLDGSLGTYKNLMLSNITDHYRDASVRRGLYAVVHGQDYENAMTYYDYARDLAPNKASIYYVQGNVRMEQNQCTKAETLYNQALSLEPDTEGTYMNAMYNLAKECYQDPERISVWEKRKGAFDKQHETPLKEL